MNNNSLNLNYIDMLAVIEKNSEMQSIEWQQYRENSLEDEVTQEEEQETTDGGQDGQVENEVVPSEKLSEPANIFDTTENQSNSFQSIMRTDGPDSYVEDFFYDLEVMVT